MEATSAFAVLDFQLLVQLSLDTLDSRRRDLCPAMKDEKAALKENSVANDAKYLGISNSGSTDANVDTRESGAPSVSDIEKAAMKQEDATKEEVKTEQVKVDDIVRTLEALLKGYDIKDVLKVATILMTEDPSHEDLHRQWNEELNQWRRKNVKLKPFDDKLKKGKKEAMYTTIQSRLAQYKQECKTSAKIGVHYKYNHEKIEDQGPDFVMELRERIQNGVWCAGYAGHVCAVKIDGNVSWIDAKKMFDFDHKYVQSPAVICAIPYPSE